MNRCTVFDKLEDEYGITHQSLTKREKAIIGLCTQQFLGREEEVLEKSKELTIHNIIDRFSGEKLMKLQKHFVSLYGRDKMAKEKANSFAVGLSKASELIIKELNKLL